MQMQIVYLIKEAKINVFEKLGKRMPISAKVDHKGAILLVGSVLYVILFGFQHLSFSDVYHLKRRRKAVHKSLLVRCEYAKLTRHSIYNVFIGRKSAVVHRDKASLAVLNVYSEDLLYLKSKRLHMPCPLALFGENAIRDHEPAVIYHLTFLWKRKNSYHFNYLLGGCNVIIP